MKIFGFNIREKSFVHVVCNVILSCVLIFTFCLCFFSFPNSQTVSTVNGAYYKGKNGVSLMFNVYTGQEQLKDIIKILKDKNVDATFFVGGCFISNQTELLNEIVDSGFEVGNHGFYHKDPVKISDDKNRNELYMCHKLVKSLCNVEMNLFAPPYGSYDNKMVNIANSFNYKVIMWSNDTIDWRDKNTKLIVERATKNLCDGSLILMHPTVNTVEALPQIIDVIQESNLKITTVSQNIGIA